MADKPVFVDLISEATRQVRRRIVRQDRGAEAKQNRGSVTGQRDAQWREQTFTPWKLKPWNWKDWDRAPAMTACETQIRRTSGRLNHFSRLFMISP